MADGKEGEDMDSLFEGMVLFNPTEIEAERRPDNHSEDDSLQSRQSDAITTSAVPASCSSQPLDENLFSDLTLVVDPLQNLEVAETEHDLQSPQSCIKPPSIISRQGSRRRKRSGLRIGYGRDNNLSDSPSALLQPTFTISDSINYDTVGETPSITTDVAVPVTQPFSESSNSENENVIHAEAEGGETFSEADFRQIKATINDKLNLARQLVNSASAARKDSIRNRRKAVENVSLASLKYMELEKQLEEACDAEDFEGLNRLPKAAEKEKQAFTNSLRDADAFIDALELKLQHALDSYIAAEEECAILLDHYATVSDNNKEPIKLAFTLFIFNRPFPAYSYLLFSKNCISTLSVLFHDIVFKLR